MLLTVSISLVVVIAFFASLVIVSALLGFLIKILVPVIQSGSRLDLQLSKAAPNIQRVVLLLI